MLWLIEKVILSLVFIMSVHYLILYFQNNLTVPKQKDLFYTPIKKYNKIYDIINEEKQSTTSIASLEVENHKTFESDMKNELKEYLQKNFKR